MRIVIAGECYSPNLGDPLLCESLRNLLLIADPMLEITMVDLSGRRSIPRSEEGRGGRSAVRQVLPKQLAADLAWIKGRRRLQATFREALRTADGLVIAGGQLLMDNWLSFPRRLSLLLQEADRWDLPAAVWACGAYGVFSARARRRLTPALQSGRIVYFGVRDHLSAVRVAEQFGVAAVVNPDPALAWLSQQSVGDGFPTPDSPVAIGVMDPASAAPQRGIPAAAIDAAFRELLAISPAGSLVFVNGESKDYAYQRLLRAQLPPKVVERLIWAERPQSPVELVRTIARGATVHCARLHAAIPAWAMGREVWLLGGDSKSEAVMDTVGVSFLARETGVGAAPLFVGTRWSGQAGAVEAGRRGVDQMLCALSSGRRSCNARRAK